MSGRGPSKPGRSGPGAAARGRALAGASPLLLESAPVGGRLCIPCGNETRTPCCVRRLRVRCDHVDRTYTIRVPDGPRTRDGTYVLQILSPHLKPDRLLVAVEGGPCINGRPGAGGPGTLIDGREERSHLWPRAEVSGPNVQAACPAPFKIEAAGPRVDVERWDLPALVRFVLDPLSVSNAYDVRVLGCCGTQDLRVRVEAFPPSEVKGELAVGYKVQKIEKLADGDRWTDRVGEWTLEGKVSLSVDDVLTEFGAPTVSRGRRFVPVGPDALYGGLRSVLRTLVPFLANVTGERPEVTLRYPNMRLSMTRSVAEARNDWRLESRGTLRLKLDPFLGLEIKIDLLPPLLRLLGTASTGIVGPAGPIVAAILLRIREQNKKYKRGVVWSESKSQKSEIDVDVGLDFIALGEISGGLGWETEGPFGRWRVADGKIDSRIAFTVKGSFKSAVRVLCVSVGGAVEAGAKSAIGARLTGKAVGKDPELLGQVYFDGLKIYWASHYDFGYGEVAEARPEDIGHDETQSELTDAKMRSTGTEDADEANTWTLLEPAAYPPDRASEVSMRDFVT